LGFRIVGFRSRFVVVGDFGRELVRLITHSRSWHEFEARFELKASAAFESDRRRERLACRFTGGVCQGDVGSVVPRATRSIGDQVTYTALAEQDLARADEGKFRV